MKGLLNRINYWYWSMLFISLAQAVPLTPATNETTTEKETCFYDDERYYEGQNRPSTNPCETCTCQPPDFACRLKTCDVKVGCKVLHSAGHCCPKYICDCQKNGHTYGNGEKVEEPNPCNVCYCRGGEIKCTGLTCYTRTDCEPHYVSGKCCPKYDHCPALDITERQPVVSSTTSDGNTTEVALPTKESLTEDSQPVGKLEIIEVYPENRTQANVTGIPEPDTSATTETTETTTESSEVYESSTFFGKMATGNDTEGLIISSAYSRVSVDSPKLAEKIETGLETPLPELTTPESEPPTLTDTTIDMENTTVTTETTPETYTSTLEDLTEDTTEFVTDTTTLQEPTSPESPETKQTSLVDMLIKWLQSKRKTGKPEVTTVATPRSEPISFLTVLQSELMRMANDSDTRARSLDTPEISQQEIADLAAALNDTDDPIRLRYPFTDESLAPVLSMISDQLQFLKVGEEQPIYIEAPPEEDEMEHRHGVVVEPTAPPITVHMVKVAQQSSDNT